MVVWSSELGTNPDLLEVAVVDRALVAEASVVVEGLVVAGRSADSELTGYSSSEMVVA